MNLRRCLSLLTSLGFAMAAPDCAQAKFYTPQVEQMPVARLIRNIEKQVGLHPQDNRLRFNLARAHAMAYALNNDRAEVPVATAEMSLFERPTYPWNYTPKFAKLSPRSPSASARAHLRKAIAAYGELLLSPALDTATARLALLGRGWCLDQAGDKQAAIDDYRRLLKDLPVEAWGSIHFEAAGYLLPLLDSSRDAAEIAELTQQRLLYTQKINTMPRYVTPIAIPLAKNATLAEIEDRGARVAFEVDTRHPGQHWSWITPKAGWLAYDPKKTGKITSGIRLFGSVSYWMFWDNGYQAMSALDDNGDGVLTGKELQGLVVWVDENGNGVCDSGEVKTLAALGIKALSYSHEPLRGHPDHIVYSPRGVQYENRSTGPSYDIILHAKR